MQEVHVEISVSEEIQAVKTFEWERNYRPIDSKGRHQVLVTKLVKRNQRNQLNRWY